jgi:hypothetical protein
MELQGLASGAQKRGRSGKKPGFQSFMELVTGMAEWLKNGLQPAIGASQKFFNTCRTHRHQRAAYSRLCRTAPSKRPIIHHAIYESACGEASLQRCLSKSESLSLGEALRCRQGIE